MADWLNYQHLYYFWAVAREGGVARAARKLDLAQSTVSGQVRALEGAMKQRLLARAGRGVRLTDLGRTVFTYADRIFALGGEMRDAVRGGPTGRPLRLAVGVANAIPKFLAHRLLAPVLALPGPVHLSCYEARLDRLMSEFSLRHLDVILSDVPAGQALKVRGHTHPLGESGVSFFAAAKLAAAHGRDFPRSLDGAPFLLPTDNTALRWSLEQWFAAEGIRPAVRGEFEDNALLKAFGQAGEGVFAVASAVEEDVREQYGVKVLGRVAAIRERFYAVTAEKTPTHPAVVAIVAEARGGLLEPA
ncbi:MAG TPA: transcriptional activator NhaR [Gemmataceae bacterium]